MSVGTSGGWSLPRLNSRRRNQLIGGTAIILVWEFIGRQTTDIVLVPFSTVVLKFFYLYSSGVIYEPLWASFQQFFFGYILAVVFSLIIGVSMGASDTVEYLLDSYVYFFFVTAIASLLPLLIIFFGIGIRFRIAVVFLYSIFHMIINFKSGIENVDYDLVETGRVYGATGLKKYRHVLLPASLPFIIAGLRLGIGRAWRGMVIAELWITAGLGFLLFGFRRNIDIGGILAVVVTLMIFGVLSVKGLYWVQHKVAPWGSEED